MFQRLKCEFNIMVPFKGYLGCCITNMACGLLFEELLYRRTSEEACFTSQVSRHSRQTICPLQKLPWSSSWEENPASGCHRRASCSHTAPHHQGRGQCACHAARGPWRRWHWWRSPSCCLERSCPPDFRNLPTHERTVRTHLLDSFLSLKGRASVLQAVACCVLRCKKACLNFRCTAQVCLARCKTLQRSDRVLTESSNYSLNTALCLCGSLL